MDRVAVIDADIILYKACRVAEEEVNWGNDQYVLWSNLNLVKTIIDDQIDLIVDQMEADRSLLCFSDTKNYRKELNPEYKANRRGGRNLHFSFVKTLIPFVFLKTLKQMMQSESLELQRMKMIM